MTDKRRGIQSIEVGWSLIEVLILSRGPLPLSELAMRADMSLSKAHTYLVSYNRIGLVSQSNETGLYELGERALQLGLAAMAGSDIIESSRSALRECRERTQGTVFLSLFGNMGPTIVYWLQGLHVVTVQVQAGSVLPLLDSATGHIFLSYLDDTSLKQVLETEIDILPLKARKSVDKRIELIRKSVKSKGLASIEGGLIANVNGIAAPIFDHENRLRATMTVIGRIDNFDTAIDGQNAKEVLKVTNGVSKSLGSRTSFS